MTTKTNATPSTADNTVQLDQPIKRDGQSIDSITLRKPTAGELRGLQLVSVLNMDVDSLSVLIPRISVPVVHKVEVLGMDPADITALGIVVGSFLQQKGG